MYNAVKVTFTDVNHFRDVTYFEQVQEDFCVGSVKVQVPGSVEDSVLEAEIGEPKVHSAHTRSGNSAAARSSC